MENKMLKTIFISFLFLVIFPINTLAAGVTNHYYNSADDNYYVHMDLSGVSKFSITNPAGGTNEFTPGSVNYTYLTCNGLYTYHFYSSGSLISTDTITATGIQSEHDSCKDTSGGDSGGGSHCGCVFNTPGWQNYMGKVDEIIAAIPSPPNYTSKLDEIIAAIPPAPNWNSVAGIFTDSMGGLLGNAPSLPSKPSSPGNINDGNLQKPQGNDSGLEGFDGNDIKDGDGIKELEDDSGGWDILDPLETMPEQETFIPEEGDLQAPEVPDVEGTAPTPEEPENMTPSNPKEPENTAPTPEEPENMTPSNPKEPENIAPTPSEPENNAPTPGDSEIWYPIPGDPGGTAPMPGSGNNNAPIPGGGSPSFPMPGSGR